MHKKALSNAFLKNGEEYYLIIILLHYKVKFILKILIIYFMNIYLLAFLLASLDTYLCYKKFIINRNNSKSFLLLIFLISFYLIVVILELLKKFI